MMMTQEEFKKLVSKNPCIRVRQPQPSSQARTGMAQAFGLDESLREEVKTQKYRNVKVYVSKSGIASHIKAEVEKFGGVADVYDSTKEYVRGKSLELLQRAGKIRNLKRQQRWLLLESFQYRSESIKAIYYKADFQYEILENDVWVTVVEDVKPLDEATGKYRTTEAFDLKWKLLKAKYPDIKFILF